MPKKTISLTAVTRRGSFGLVAGALAASTAPVGSALPDHRDWSSLDRMAADAVARRLTPGIQLSVMERGGLVYSKAFGSANLETGTPLTSGSVLRIGSITKQFTAAALLKLQEDGRLSLDDPLSRFIPEVGPTSEQVTLRQMLTHVSGLGIDPAGSQLVQRGTQILEHDAASIVATIASRNPALRTPPGTHWLYNNLAYRLLGVVAERASGVRLRELFKARLFDPAGLTRTAVDDMSEVVAGRASGYSAAPDASGMFRNALPISLSWPGGGGSMISTTDDLCRWHHHLLGGRILSSQSTASMMTPVRLVDGSLPPHPADADPALTGPLRYGLGIRMRTENGLELVTHTGGIDGFLSELTSYPTRQVTVAVMTNSGRSEGSANLNESALRATLREGARIALS